MRIAIAILTLASCTKPPVAREEHPAPTTMVGTGHPYWRQLSRDARGRIELPEGVELAATPNGCFRLAADGTITATKLAHASGQPVIDDAVKRALDATMRDRDSHPVALPRELRGTLDGWVCMPLETEPTDDSSPVEPAPSPAGDR